jgi:hypothetical protein
LPVLKLRIFGAADDSIDLDKNEAPSHLPDLRKSRGSGRSAFSPAEEGASQWLWCRKPFRNSSGFCSLWG